METIRISQFLPKDYPMIKSWWDVTDEPCAPLEFFPETTYIASIDGIPAVSAILIVSNTPICWMTAPIGNPEFKGKTRKEAFKTRLSFMESEAKKLGKTIMFTMNSKEGLINRFMELGFKKTHNDMTFFAKRVGE